MLVIFFPAPFASASPNSYQVYLLLCTDSKYVFLDYFKFSSRSIEQSRKKLNKVLLE